MDRIIIGGDGFDDAGGRLPISEAVLWNGLLFVSGQTAPEAVGFDEQARLVLQKMGVLLKDGGSDYNNVLWCGVYLADGSTRQRLNEIYREFFPKNPPARTTIKCELAPRTLIEIDCIAIKAP